MRLPVREHHGVQLPVPWVTLWTSESSAQPSIRPYKTRWGFISVRVEPTSIGEGEPEWQRVHTGRSMLSVRRGLCQVCGERGADVYRTSGEDNANFGWQSESGDAQTGMDVVVSEPATCLACVPRAERLCPQVRDNGPYRWWHTKRLAIVGGQFGPPEGKAAVPVMLVEGQRVPDGFVLKQPFVAVTLLEEVRP